MSVFATDNPIFSNVVKYEFEPSINYAREVIVINDTAQTLLPGTVLGKVTSNGKYKVALSGASDGSQVPAAVYTGTGLTLVNATDTTTTALVRGPVLLNDAGIVMGTGITLSVVKAAFALLNPPILFNVGV